jgi:hypothetical protein
VVRRAPETRPERAQFESAPSYANFDVLKVELDDAKLVYPYPDCHLTNEAHRRVRAALLQWLGAQPSR